MATSSEVARYLDVDRDSILRWASRYAEFLSAGANPPKGQEREFSEADLRVFALIAEQTECGEDSCDIELSLRLGEQDEDRFSEFACLHTPMFQNLPEDIDDTWQHGVVIGGMAERDFLHIARAYKLAADEILKQALGHLESHQVDYPILFLYRHCVELYLKILLTTPPEHHDLNALIKLLEKQYGEKLGGWVRDRLQHFHDIDVRSDLFRYPEFVPNGELWIDFHQLKMVMDRLIAAFEAQIHHGKATPRFTSTDS